MYVQLLNCSSAGVLMEKKDDLNALNFREIVVNQESKA